MVGSAVIKQGRSANRKHTYFFFWPYDFYLEIIICDPLIYAMDHPKFILSNQKEESIRT